MPRPRNQEVLNDVDALYDRAEDDHRPEAAHIQMWLPGEHVDITEGIMFTEAPAPAPNGKSYQEYISEPECPFKKEMDRIWHGKK